MSLSTTSKGHRYCHCLPLPRETDIVTVYHFQGKQILLLSTTSKRNRYCHCLLLPRETDIVTVYHFQGKQILLLSTTSKGHRYCHCLLLPRETDIVTVYHFQGKQILLLSTTSKRNRYCHCLPLPRETDIVTVYHFQGKQILSLTPTSKGNSYCHCLPLFKGNRYFREPLAVYGRRYFFPYWLHLYVWAATFQWEITFESRKRLQWWLNSFCLSYPSFWWKAFFFPESELCTWKVAPYEMETNISRTKLSPSDVYLIPLKEAVTGGQKQ